MNTTQITTTAETTNAAKTLLACGIIAGPLYTVVGLAQAFTRPGFDITRHALSMLSNGDLGWIQVSNFLVIGLLVMAGAVGMRMALQSGVGRTWGPILVGVYGLSLIGAAIFKADPGLGFPPGTPDSGMTMSTSGLMHFASGGVGFLALIIACFVFARRFASQKQGVWAAYSVFTGVAFFAAFFGIASGSGNSLTILGFWVGLVLVWVWLSVLCARFRVGLVVQ
jgi:hypothetical protein